VAARFLENSCTHALKATGLKKKHTWLSCIYLHHKINNNIRLVIQKHGNPDTMKVSDLPFTLMSICLHSKNVLLHCLYTIKILFCFSEEFYVLMDENINTMNTDTKYIRNLCRSHFKTKSRKKH
jgi:hypothetical protein